MINFSNKQWFILLSVGSFWLLLTLLTVDRLPWVWVDEVSYADPAVRLVKGSGFTSTAWYAQGAESFWAGNVPGYQFLLAGWLSVSGVNIYTVRIFNLVLLVGSLFLAYFVASKYLKFSSNLVVILLAVLLCADSSFWASRMGRPDIVGLLLFWIYVLSYFERRKVWIAGLLGFTMPFFGLQFVLYFGLLTVAMIAFRRELGIFYWSALLLVGVVSGGLTLLALYHQQGVLDAFLESLRPHVGDLAPSHVPNGMGAVFVDKSQVLLISGLVILCYGLINSNTGTMIKITYNVSAFLIFFVFPIIINAIGVYPVYYSWMTLLPGIVVFCLMLQKFSICTFCWKGAYFAIMAFCILGFPARTMKAILEWDSRDPSKLENVFLDVVRPGDVLLADYAVFYLANQSGNNAFYRLRAMELTCAVEPDLIITRSRNISEFDGVIFEGYRKVAETGFESISRRWTNLLMRPHVHRLSFWRKDPA